MPHPVRWLKEFTAGWELFLGLVGWVWFGQIWNGVLNWSLRSFPQIQADLSFLALNLGVCFWSWYALFRLVFQPSGAVLCSTHYFSSSEKQSTLKFVEPPPLFPCNLQLPPFVFQPKCAPTWSLHDPLKIGSPKIKGSWTHF